VRSALTIRFSRGASRLHQASPAASRLLRFMVRSHPLVNVLACIRRRHDQPSRNCAPVRNPRSESILLSSRTALGGSRKEGIVRSQPNRRSSAQSGRLGQRCRKRLDVLHQSIDCPLKFGRAVHLTAVILSEPFNGRDNLLKLRAQAIELLARHGESGANGAPPSDLLRGHCSFPPLLCGLQVLDLLH
jgi:hypothetical protein